MLFRPASPDDEACLADLFAALVAAGDDRLFHPHPLTREAARSACRHRLTARVPSAADEYHVAVVEADARGGRETIVGYGLLRGWAEGFAIPSLGVAIHPGHRGRGIARRFMEHLHRVAASRDTAAVRLKVYRHNAAALRLYESLGYELRPHSATELLGFLAVTAMAAA